MAHADDLADVTVIVPAYQAETTIGRALASIAHQDLKPRSVVVVDDGSTDCTFERARAMGDVLTPIVLTVLRQENRGAGAARNRALAEATTKLVAFLDADDEWLPNKLAVSLQALEGSPLTLVSHNYIQRDVAGTLRQIDCHTLFREARVPFVALYRRGFIATSTVVAPRRAIIEAGGFDEALRTAQDFDLWLRMLAQPQRAFAVLPDYLTIYYVSPEGITSGTRRRLDLTKQIAEARAPLLRNFPGSVLASLWFRLIAVHWEAASAHWRRGRFGQLIGVACALPVAMVRISARVLRGLQPMP